MTRIAEWMQPRQLPHACNGLASALMFHLRSNAKHTGEVDEMNSILHSLEEQRFHTIISPNQRIRAHKPPCSLPSAQIETPTHRGVRPSSIDTKDCSSTFTPSSYSFDAPGLGDNRLTPLQGISQAPTTMQSLNHDLSSPKALYRRICASLSRNIKEHHRSVNAAFYLLYGSRTTDDQKFDAANARSGFSQNDAGVGGFKKSMERYHYEMNGEDKA
ncbi:hypothetical protein BU24DRAFT_406124 [Aaosphaeria arxii CBS 175.79]|uniref:Uncharacterized protein n=1 Tax=Aaosphaeria arxii CBS 175.79 TaxID=1450172 RepID=A0A6A5Y1L7_9PLEO|nr:uncharacterized protein BU24DRAFT_406124 [Aaosphaeria arxii CBS 175.79]KAF2019455.1 hypothetical protein BU24DRAFT_406124 [Aaosphaeria arxii CBS 175.79]